MDIGSPNDPGQGEGGLSPTPAPSSRRAKFGTAKMGKATQIFPTSSRLPGSPMPTSLDPKASSDPIEAGKRPKRKKLGHLASTDEVVVAPRLSRK